LKVPLVLIFSVSLMVSSFSPEVRSIPKRIRFDEKDRNYVAFEGRWSLTTSPEDSTLPAANSVQVRCWKEMGRCTEAIAMLYRKSDSNSMSDLSGRLSVIMFEHQITEWSDTVIRTQSNHRYRDPYLIGGPFCRAKPARNECPRCVLGGSKNRPALDTAIKPTFCHLKMGRRSQPKQEACNFFRTPGRPLKPQPRPPKSRLIAELFLPG